MPLFWKQESSDFKCLILIYSALARAPGGRCSFAALSLLICCSENGKPEDFQRESRKFACSKRSRPGQGFRGFRRGAIRRMQREQQGGEFVPGGNPNRNPAMRRSRLRRSADRDHSAPSADGRIADAPITATAPVGRGAWHRGGRGGFVPAR